MSATKTPRLSKRRALRAAANMELSLRGMVDYLQEKFYDDSEIVVRVDRDDEDNVIGEYRRPKYSLKEKTGIAMFFARTTALKEQVVEEKGLRDKKSDTSNPLVVAIGGNVAVFKSLPPEKRQELLLKLASGEIAALPAPETPAV